MCQPSSLTFSVLTPRQDAPSRRKRNSQDAIQSSLSAMACGAGVLAGTRPLSDAAPESTVATSQSSVSCHRALPFLIAPSKCGRH